MFALVFLNVFGGEGQTGDRECLPVLLLVVLARKAQVDHDGGGVAGARQQLDGLPQLEHPVNQHPSLLQLLEFLLPVCHLQDAVEGHPFL